MSGESHPDGCPRCGGLMHCYSNYKPYDLVSGICLDCGFHYSTVSNLMSLDEINKLREDYGYDPEPLKELRKPTQEWLDSGYEPVPVGRIDLVEKEAIKVEDGTITIDFKNMKLGEFYPIKKENKLYLYRRVDDHKLEVYVLISKEKI